MQYNIHKITQSQEIQPPEDLKVIMNFYSAED